MSFLNDAKYSFRSGNVTNQLIVVNVAIFLAVLLPLMVLQFISNIDVYTTVINFLGVPYSFGDLLYKPFTFITYMFVHDGPFHLLFNMLVLYWFGMILTDLIGQRRILPVYLLGGIAAAIFSLAVSHGIALTGNSAAQWSYVVGASGAVMAIMFAAATLAPNYKVGLLFFGPVAIKYIALFYLVIDLFFLADNTGGRLAHIGGAIFGALYIVSLRRGVDLGKPITQFFDWVKNLGTPKPKMQANRQKQTVNTYTQANSTNTRRTVDFTNLSPSERQQRIDTILDKISRSGYDSLTKEEKDILFKASKD